MITDCAAYEAGTRREGELPLHRAKEAADDPEAFVWLGLKEPTPEEFEAITKEFSLPELAVEDALKPHQRPKLELYGDLLFLVLRTTRYVDPVEIVDIGQIMVFLGDSFVITVRHGTATALGGVRRDLERRPEFLSHGPAAVLHAVLDKVVDDYVPALEGLDQDVSEVERDVFDESSAEPIERIYRLKREVLEFHRAVAPLMEPLDRLVRGVVPHIDPATRQYFRDVQDHLLRVAEQVADLNNLLSSMLNASLAQVTRRQNEDMRRISAWVAIAAVPTAVAGIYGMNFEHMPELTWTFGYPLVLVVIAVACLFLYYKFKRAGWL
jgi:magnesium transporter